MAYAAMFRRKTLLLSVEMNFWRWQATICYNQIFIRRFRWRSLDWNLGHKGYFCYSPSTDKVVVYAKINEQYSSHVIYEDSNKDIWVGSWGYGLFKLRNPKDMENVSYQSFLHENGDDSSLSDNIVYDIAEDINTHTLWVGTRSGLSILRL